jgi:hypothetical protein
MNIRKTDVGWDPNLVRVEYLDEECNPFYCYFETRNDNNNEGEFQDLLEINADASQEPEDIATKYGWFGVRSGLPHYSLFMLAAWLIAFLGAVVLASR